MARGLDEAGDAFGFAMDGLQLLLTDWTAFAEMMRDGPNWLIYLPIIPMVLFVAVQQIKMNSLQHKIAATVPARTQFGTRVPGVYETLLIRSHMPQEQRGLHTRWMLWTFGPLAVALILFLAVF